MNNHNHSHMQYGRNSVVPVSAAAGERRWGDRTDRIKVAIFGLMKRTAFRTPRMPVPVFHSCLCRRSMFKLVRAATVLLLTVLLFGQGCASPRDPGKAPPEAWEKLARGEAVDLIVQLDDSAVLTQASELNRAKGVAFDGPETLHFKRDAYAAIKRDVQSSSPPSEIEQLHDYDLLPLLFLRFHSAAALKSLVAQPSVVRAFEDKARILMPQEAPR